VRLGYPIGNLAAIGALALLSQLPEADFLAWGWRIPFLISILLYWRPPTITVSVLLMRYGTAVKPAHWCRPRGNGLIGWKHISSKVPYWRRLVSTLVWSSSRCKRVISSFRSQVSQATSVHDNGPATRQLGGGR
jgi:hypothetical protein